MAVKEAIPAGRLQLRPGEPEHNPRLFDAGGAKDRFRTGSKQSVVRVQDAGKQMARKHDLPLPLGRESAAVSMPGAVASRINRA